jgi:tRNA A-37 threonylcarbamoyl transferase component Bud32
VSPGVSPAIRRPPRSLRPLVSGDDGASSGTLVGTILQGRYRLTRLISKGGMGAVYEAIQLRLHKRVAVKVMKGELSTNEEALARFRREAEVTSQLGHPHIVQLFDFGETSTGEPYLVMEYLDGEDLERRLARVGRFSLEATARVVRQVASALAAAHARGVVHRDLKPANVFLERLEDEGDFVKVVDFGISKVRMATTKLTGEKVVLGTPSYMSPEQASGRIDDIDRRTDEWSLACIAYEMLVGHPPFRGDDLSAVLYQVIHREPAPLIASLPQLSPGVDQVLARALSKAQGDRFPTVSAFARALDAVAAGRSVPTDEANPAGGDPTANVLAQSPAGDAPRFLTATEVIGPARPPARASIGRYVVAVAIAASAALGVSWVRGQRARAPGPLETGVAQVSAPAVPVPAAGVGLAAAPASPAQAVDPFVPAVPAVPAAAIESAAGPPVETARRPRAAPPGSPARSTSAADHRTVPPRAKVHLIQNL